MKTLVSGKVLSVEAYTRADKPKLKMKVHIESVVEKGGNILPSFETLNSEIELKAGQEFIAEARFVAYLPDGAKRSELSITLTKLVK